MHNEITRPLLSWQYILAIATTYRMTRVRNRAVREISGFHPRIDPIEQIVLAVNHGVDEWLPVAYTALCQREDAIQLEEAEKIGIVTTVKLNIAREFIRKRSSSPEAPFDRYLVNSVVFEVFWPGEDVPEPESLDEDVSTYQAFSAEEKEELEETLVEEMIEREFSPATETFNSYANLGDLINLGEDGGIGCGSEDKADEEETELPDVETRERFTSVPTGMDAPKVNQKVNPAMAAQSE